MGHASVYPTGVTIYRPEKCFTASGMNMIYRAYRYPYSYVPQLGQQEELAVLPINNTQFRLPNAADADFAQTVSVAGTTGYDISAGFCVSEEQ